MDSTSARRLTLQSFLPILGMALLLAAPFVYLALINNELQRRTALVSFVMIFAGMGLTAYSAFIDPRLWKGILATVQALMTAFAVFAWIFWAKLPSNQSPAIGMVAPDFVTVDQNAKTFQLRPAHAKGPLLLVFYRGYW